MKILKFNLITATYLSLIPLGFILLQIKSNNIFAFTGLTEAQVHRQEVADGCYMVSTTLVALILLIISLILARKHKMNIIGQIIGIVGALTVMPLAFSPIMLEDSTSIWGDLIQMSIMIPINLLFAAIVLLIVFCRYKKEK